MYHNFWNKSTFFKPYVVKFHFTVLFTHSFPISTLQTFPPLSYFPSFSTFFVQSCQHPFQQGFIFGTCNSSLIYLPFYCLQDTSQINYYWILENFQCCTTNDNAWNRFLFCCSQKHKYLSTDTERQWTNYYWRKHFNKLQPLQVTLLLNVIVYEELLYSSLNIQEHFCLSPIFCRFIWNYP